MDVALQHIASSGGDFEVTRFSGDAYQVRDNMYKRAWRLGDTFRISRGDNMLVLAVVKPQRPDGHAARHFDCVSVQAVGTVLAQHTKAAFQRVPAQTQQSQAQQQSQAVRSPGACVKCGDGTDAHTGHPTWGLCVHCFLLHEQEEAPCQYDDEFDE